MTPVYFPFTYIGASVWRAMTAVFEQVAVYQPSSREIPEDLQAKVDSGGLKLRIPVRTQASRLSALLQDYRIWAAQQQSGGGLEAIMRQAAGAGVPLYDETAPTRIKAQTQRPESRWAQAPDPLFRARLFLSLAQELDVQSAAAEHGLGRVEELEGELLRNLRGEPPAGGQGALRREATPASRLADYMAAERLRAWTRLLLSDTHPGRLYLTSSRFAWQGCLEIGTDAHLLADPFPLSVNGAARAAALQWRRRTQQLLQRAEEGGRGEDRRTAAVASLPHGTAEQPMLTVARIPAVGPAELFGAVLAQRPLPAAKVRGAGNGPDTFVCLLDLG